MSRSWVRFSRTAWTILLVFLAGCYEGPRRLGQGDGGGGGGEGKPGTPQEKPIGILIVHFFYPSETAISKSNCDTVPGSLTDLRILEMRTRMNELTKSLQTQADFIKTILVEIDNCDPAQAIERAATQSSLEEYEIRYELRLKPLVHVRFAYSFGEPTTQFPTNAAVSEWADMTRLANAGFQKRLSVAHVVRMGPARGYIYNWSLNLPWDSAYFASVIESPIPNDSGTAEVLNAIRTSTVGFMNWLKPKVEGL